MKNTVSLADVNESKAYNIISSFRGVTFAKDSLRTYVVMAKLGTDKIEKLMQKLERAGIWFDSRPAFVCNKDAYLIDFPRVIMVDFSDED